jgi:hypothetical protein
LSFCHRLPFDRSSLTHWRRRLGEGELAALIQDSLAVAHKSRALASRDLEWMVVDTTVQPKGKRSVRDACRRSPPWAMIGYGRDSNGSVHYRLSGHYAKPR